MTSATNSINPFVRNNNAPYAVKVSETVYLGRVVEIDASAGTVKQATDESILAIGVASETQARSAFQSDGTTARAANAVYAGETLTVGMQGVYLCECAESHGISAGDYVCSGGNGKVKKFVIGTDPGGACVGKAVSVPAAIGTTTYVEVLLNPCSGT